MLKSRLTAGVYVFTAACLLATWAYSQAPKSSRNPASVNSATSIDPLTGSPVSTSTDDAFLLNPHAKKAAKSSRIMFESNWKNVQVGSKPMYFRQGDKSFVWTVKNTGDNPVEVGDDYGFSIAPGEEDFIVDTRLTLSVANDKATTVEVKASRVMTQSELTQESQPTPATPQVMGPSPFEPIPSNGVPTYSPSPTPAAPTPNDPFGPTPAPSKPKRDL